MYVPFVGDARTSLSTVSWKTTSRMVEPRAERIRYTAVVSFEGPVVIPLFL